jgi:hypothetical protein
LAALYICAVPINKNPIAAVKRKPVAKKPVAKKRVSVKKGKKADWRFPKIHRYIDRSTDPAFPILLWVCT